MFSYFSDDLKMILNGAKKEMKLLHHSYIGTEHFLLSILKNDNDIKKILNDLSINYDLFKNKIIENIGYGNEKKDLYVFTPLFKKILEEAIYLNEEQRCSNIDLSFLFKLILDEGEGVAFRVLCDLNIDIDSLYDLINCNINKDESNMYLKEVGLCLNDKVLESNDILVGREKELDNIIEILLRKNKRNPILIGEAGVGKTAIVEALARKITLKDVPLKLVNKKIYSLSMATLISGTKYRGEFEEKVLKIIKELEKRKDYILFIDEIHTLVGAGGAEGAIDASNILKPALARDNITVIGATTIEEYKKYFEDDKALDRRFQKVIVKEPNKEELLDILKKVKVSYEKYHNVIINNSIIKYIIDISSKYIKNRKEPDRSIDIIDEVSSLVSSRISDEQIINNNLKKKLSIIKERKDNYLKNNNYDKALKYRKKERLIESKINNNDINIKTSNKPTIIKKEDVNKVISSKYNICLSNTKVIKKDMILQKNKLKEIFVNQELLIDNIYNFIEQIFIVDKKIDKPISILLTGKEDKKSIIEKISEISFNNNLIKVDLNEYRDNESINKIVGSAPGYIGYNDKKNVFEPLKENPITVVVFDNFELASLKIKNFIKQILNTGYFIDSNNYKIDFSNSLIIITSNKESKKSIGFLKEQNIYDDLGLNNFVTSIINLNNLSNNKLTLVK